jgi:hypothetical protein
MFFSIKNFIYLATIPVIYSNIYICHATPFINFIYSINIFLNYETILLDVVDNFCITKIYINDKINTNKNIINNLLYKIGYYKNTHFEYELLNAYLYVDLSKRINIKSFFTTNHDINNIDKINKQLFLQIYNYFNIEFQDNIHLRIKLDFVFCDKPYVLYIPYYLEDNIPYPPYTNKIIDNYKNNIVIPYHKISNKKYPLYSFLSMNFREIDECKIHYNDGITIDIKEYVKKINTPFNDMGILYNCNIPILWVCIDNSININYFKKICLKYSNYYFNEEKMELEENIFECNDLNSMFLSPYVKEYIDNKSNNNN